LIGLLLRRVGSHATTQCAQTHFEEIVHEGELEHQVQIDFMIFEDVLERALRTVLGEDAGEAVNDGAIEADETRQTEQTDGRTNKRKSACFWLFEKKRLLLVMLNVLHCLQLHH
jgi:hypothetical protein